MDIQQVLDNQPELKQYIKNISSDPDCFFPVLSAKFKLTWQCNLRCVMCRIWQKPSPSLAPDVVIHALSALAEQGLKKVHFSGGEILLYPHIFEVISHARSLGLQVNITTNGTLLSKELARFLITLRVHTVTVSIDGPDAKNHDRIRGLPGAFKATLHGLDLIKARKQKKGRGPKLAVNTVVSRPSIKHLPRLFDLLDNLDIDDWRILPMDTEQKALRPTADQWETLMDMLPGFKPLLSRTPLDWSSDRSGSRAEKGKFAGVFYGSHLCYAPWFHVFVDADGKVYPCCNGKQDMTPFANLNDVSMTRILDSSIRRDIRYSMAAGHRFAVCDQCDDFLNENLMFHNIRC